LVVVVAHASELKFPLDATQLGSGDRLKHAFEEVIGPL